MRNFIRQDIINILDIIIEGLTYLNNRNCTEEEKKVITTSIEHSIEEIKNAIESNLNKNKPSKYLPTINKTKKLLSKLSENYLSESISRTISEIEDLRKDVESTALTINIVFICYNYSMWDSFHTIWKSSSADKNCDVVVLPVPYYEIKSNGNLQKHDVNIDIYPSELNAQDYKAYSIKDSKPDIVYIHNPYDQYNKVTILDEDYFSYNLKKICGILVYIPYYLAARRFSEFDAFSRNPGLIYGFPAEKNADYIIVSTDEWSKAMQSAGCEYYKIISIGSPKIEATAHYKELSNGLHKEWKKQASGRKIILLNSSITDLLRHENYIEKIRDIIESLISTEIFIIWRPHPHFKKVIESMKPELINEFESLVKHVEKSKTTTIDLNEGAYDAITASDALISDNSSLLKTYLYTEKPILDISTKPNPKATNCILDIYSTYNTNINCSLDEFIMLIKNEMDPLKKERICRANKKLHAIDGAGDRIHKEVIFKYSNQLSNF